MERTSTPGLSKIESHYALYWRDVCRYIRSRFSPPPDAEDIAQSAFLKLSEVENIDTIQNHKSFLFKTASNLVVDYHRSPKNYQPSDSEINALDSEKNSDVRGPETVSMNRQEAFIVERTLMSLPERDRAFVLMNRLENLTYTEIAKQAGMSRSGVQKVITQALEKCLKAVQQASEHEDTV